MFDRESYQRACSGLRLGQEKLEEMIQMTENQKKGRAVRPVRVVLLAAALAAVLGVSALAANPEVAEQVQNFIFGYTLTFTSLEGSDMEAGVAMEGSVETNVMAAMTLPPMAYEVRDGRNILTIDGEERDVTEAMEKDGCYETKGEGYSLKLMPDGTVLVDLDDGLGNSMSCKLLLNAEGVVPNADRFQTDGPVWQWTEEDGEIETAQRIDGLPTDEGN